jgi:hypothetical protein
MKGQQRAQHRKPGPINPNVEKSAEAKEKGPLTFPLGSLSP